MKEYRLKNYFKRPNANSTADMELAALRGPNLNQQQHMSRNSSKKLLESITTAGRVVVRDYGRGPSRYQVTIYCAAAQQMMKARYFERESAAMGHARKWLAEHPAAEIPQLGGAAV